MCENSIGAFQARLAIVEAQEPADALAADGRFGPVEVGGRRDELAGAVPFQLALHVAASRPHLALRKLPGPAPSPVQLELLWTRASDDQPALQFVRERMVEAVAALEGEARKAWQRL